MVVLTLTLGVGATTAIFSVVSGVLLRSLPFPHPERLISLQTKAYPQVSNGQVGNTTLENVSIPDFFDWRDQTHTFEAIASYAYGTSRKFTPEGNSQQPIELGLRVALGAQRDDVFVLAVRRGLLLAAIGLIGGLVGFSILGRVLAGMLYSFRAFDPFTMIAAGATLILVSFLASAVPAWRAAQLEPTEALREL